MSIQPELNKNILFIVYRMCPCCDHVLYDDILFERRLGHGITVALKQLSLHTAIEARKKEDLQNFGGRIMILPGDFDRIVDLTDEMRKSLAVSGHYIEMERMIIHSAFDALRDLSKEVMKYENAILEVAFIEH